MALELVGPRQPAGHSPVHRLARVSHLQAQFLTGERQDPVLRVGAEGRVDSAQEEVEVRRAAAGQQRPKLLHLLLQLRPVALAEHVGEHADPESEVAAQGKVDGLAQGVVHVAGVVGDHLQALLLGQRVAVELRGPGVAEALQLGLADSLGLLARLGAGFAAWAPSRALGQEEGAGHQAEVLGAAPVDQGPHVLQDPTETTREE